MNPHRTFFLALAWVVFICFTPSGVQAAATYVWTSGEDGYWTDPSNWSGNHIPNGGDDSAWIDGRSTQVTVTIPYTNTQVIDLCGLQVDLGDTLAFQRNQVIELVKNSGLDPILTNNGEILLAAAGVNTDKLRANDSTVAIQGSGTIRMGPGPGNMLEQINGGSFVHGSEHIIRGRGCLDAPMVNRGSILADSIDGELIISGPMDNSNGAVGAIAEGHVLRLNAPITGGLIDPGDGSIYLNGATLTDTRMEAGNVYLTYQSWLQGSTTLEGTKIAVGHNTLNLIPREGESQVLLTNNGKINLAGTGVHQSLVQADGAEITLGGNGIISSWGNAGLAGINNGTFINSPGHTIQGSGYINAPMTNKGRIQALDGKLTINGRMDNTEGLLDVQGVEGDLTLSSKIIGGLIDPGDQGLVQLLYATLENTTIEKGQVWCGAGTFRGDQVLNGTDFLITRSTLTIEPDDSGSDPVITNKGTIQLLPYGAGGSTLFINGCRATLSGAGQMAMGRYSELKTLDTGSLVNDIGHFIHGYGQFHIPVENNGLIQVQNGTLRIFAPLTGFGRLFISPTGLVDLRAGIETKDFFLAHTAGISMPLGPVPMEIRGNLSFAYTDEARWYYLGLNPVFLNGGGAVSQHLEAGGQDLGPDDSGFTSNFQLDRLTIEGNGTRVYLADTVDNGNRTSGEALYVDQLEVLPGARLNLNGIHLYTRSSGAEEGDVFLVSAGTGGLVGGGSIIDEPVSMADLDASPRSLFFEDTAVGAQGDIQTITLVNSGNESVTFSGITLTGNNFLMDEACLGTSLSSGGSCAIDMAFTPLVPGEAAGKIIIKSDDPGEPYIEIPLSGTGYKPEICLGDLNGDRQVDGLDLDLFSSDFGKTSCQGMCDGDIDLDNDADGKDLSILANDFHRQDCL